MSICVDKDDSSERQKNASQVGQHQRIMGTSGDNGRCQ
jgi:hypothetical protein